MLGFKDELESIEEIHYRSGSMGRNQDLNLIKSSIQLEKSSSVTDILRTFIKSARSLQSFLWIYLRIPPKRLRKHYQHSFGY
jgi:hypothetical protein